MHIFPFLLLLAASCFSQTKSDFIVIDQFDGEIDIAPEVLYYDGVPES